MSEEKQYLPIGGLLDALGVRANIPEGHMAVDAIVGLRMLDEHGNSYVKLLWSQGMDWISRRGLIETVLDEEKAAVRQANT